MSGADLLRDVTLQPWPAPKTEEMSQLDLLVQIEQLTTERGHLRNITEKSLQEDKDAGTDLPEDSLDTSVPKKEETKEQSRDERLKDVFRVQQEMASHLEWARFAANNAVDLLSLILSIDPARRNPHAFTPAFREQGLNQGLPYGSFGLSKENHDQHVRKPDELKSLQDYQQRQELVAKGARMDALDTATDEILKAAKDLEKEVRRETKYWQEVVSISDKGWPIQRLRSAARNPPFAVRYGPPEASDHFKARGVAPLQMDKDGSILLHPALALKPKTLRVRISENGKITGTTQAAIVPEQNDCAIEQTIQLARDSLFEEELYHEISLETRQLLAYGVDFRDSVIQINIGQATTQPRQTKVLIDCIPLDEQVTSVMDHARNWLAQTIAEGLRLLLSHEHSMRLYRRSQVPPPLSGQKREKLPPPLLRTMIAILHHLECVDSLYSYLDLVSKTLRNAGLDVALGTNRETSWSDLKSRIQEPSRKGMSATDQLFEIFMKPFDGKATLSLPAINGGQPEPLVISTRTVIGQPTFGTEHKLSLPSSFASDLGLFQQQKFSSVEEAKSYLDWILSLHVTHRQMKADFSSKVTVKGNEPRISFRSKDGKKGVLTEWDIEAELANGDLKVVATLANAPDDNEQSHVWTSGGPTMLLKDKISGWTE